MPMFRHMATVAPAQLRYPPLMRRIERLINLIAALLEAARPLTADEIRTSIQGYDQAADAAFRRAFERDKEALRAMGIPLETRPVDAFGTEGYVIPKALYYLPNIDFQPDELAAIRIAAGAILGASEAARAGSMKLAAGDGPLPATRIVWGADVAADSSLLGPLYAGVLQRRAVLFEHRRGGVGEWRRRELEPYGLVHRRGHWYVVGRDRDRNATRAFKLSHIRPPVRMSTDEFDAPDGFDAAAHIDKVTGSEVETVTVRFDRDFRWWAETNAPGAAATEACDGALDVEMPAGNIDELVSWAIGFGGGVEILAPEAVRARLLDHLAPFLQEEK